LANEVSTIDTIRALATNGIDLPVLNVFRMFSRMSGRRLEVESDSAVPLEHMLSNGVRMRPDISAVACLDDGRVSLIAWHYHDDDLPGPSANVTLKLMHIPAAAKSPKVRRFQIDREHSNAYTTWLRMGRPQEPTSTQYAELEREGRLTEIKPPEFRDLNGPNLSLQFDLPRQAVSLFEITWKQGLQ
jgi:xylan 1,4-beta-xylosidase